MPSLKSVCVECGAASLLTRRSTLFSSEMDHQDGGIRLIIEDALTTFGRLTYEAKGKGLGAMLFLAYTIKNVLPCHADHHMLTLQSISDQLLHR